MKLQVFAFCGLHLWDFTLNKEIKNQKSKRDIKNSAPNKRE